MSETNPYCEALGIRVPRLEMARRSSDANYYSLLIVALLERGEPLTLQEAATRFEEAGVAPADCALLSLKRCKPARPPIHRDGELYALDPYDDDADLWAFRLGLKPPEAAPVRIVRPAPGPSPSAGEPLNVAHLDEAWRDGIPSNWSAQRTAICVLDAHGTAMHPEEVLAFVRTRSQRTLLSVDSAKCWRRGAAIRVRDDGSWELDTAHHALRSARTAVRDCVEAARRRACSRPDPAVIEANTRRFDRERQAHADQLGRMRRTLIHAFPAKEPQAVVLLDVGQRKITTSVGKEIGKASVKLLDAEIIAAVGVRALLRTLGFEPGKRRLAELGPPQKTKKLNKRGRKLEITNALLVHGSCGISRPFGDEKTLHGYLRDGKLGRLRRRLEADAKSLFALYQYGRLHGAVRLRWGFLDERIPAPWVHRDEPTLRRLMLEARELGVPLEVVAGHAPAWTDPWSRVRRAYVEVEDQGWQSWLVDEHGHVIDEDEVQLARLTAPGLGNA